MSLDKESYLSIVQLIVFLPALCFAIFVCSRHGWRRAAGWIYTLILCVIRILGAIFQLIAYSQKDESMLKTAVVFDSVGLSPLLFATLGLISRFIDSLGRDYPLPMVNIKILRLVQTLITIGMILGIVGGTSATPSSDGTVHPSGTSKFGNVLYCLAFAAITAIFLTVLGHRQRSPAQERRVLTAVAAAWPFILVRLAYSILGTFTSIQAFKAFGGSIIVRAVMSVVEEFAVVAMYLILGSTLRKLAPEEHRELSNRPWRAKKGEPLGSH